MMQDLFSGIACMFAGLLNIAFWPDPASVLLGGYLLGMGTILLATWWKGGPTVA